MKSWECSQVEIIYEKTSLEKFELALDECAKLVYDLLCQLENPIEASETLAPPLRKSEEADVA